MDEFFCSVFDPAVAAVGLWGGVGLALTVGLLKSLRRHVHPMVVTGFLLVAAAGAVANMAATDRVPAWVWSPCVVAAVAGVALVVYRWGEWTNGW